MDADLFDIVLLEPPLTPIRVYQLVARFGGLSTKRARSLVNGAPAPIVTGRPRAQAEAIKIQLGTVGAVVRLQASEGTVRP